MPFRKRVSKVWRRIGQKSVNQRRPQTTPESSITPTSAREPAREPQHHATAVDKPVPHEPPPTTAAVQSSPCIAQPPHQAVPNIASPSRQPGRLWKQAYEAVREDKPQVVGNYEMLLRYVLGGESDPADRREMDRLVREGLERTKKEVATKQKIEEGMHIVSSVRGLVNTAIKHAPEAAAAWGGVCLLLQVLENPIKEASANRDGLIYVISRMDWYWELSSLLEEDREGTSRLRDKLEQHIVALYKKLLSYQMESVYSHYRSRVAVALRDAVKFDNWAGIVQSLNDAEKTVQQYIDTHATQEMRMSLNNVAKEAELRRTLLQDIHQAIRENTKKHEEWRQDDKVRKCLSDLYLSNPRLDKERIEDTKGGLFPGASNWILDHEDFQKWRHCDDISLLWIKGDPGKGKTMILIAIVNELERQLRQEQQLANGTTVLSYFFCQGTNQDLDNATAVLRGLIYLLGDQHPPLVSHILKDYDHSGSKLFNDENSFFALSKMLKRISNDEGLSRAYLVVDALDECMTGQKQLMELIAYHAKTSSRLKWIVSSRNNHTIERHLGMNSGTKLGLEITENAEQVSRAVSAYIEDRISKLPALRNDRELRDRIQRTMSKKAAGTFLWVALVFQELEHPDVESWHVLQIVNELPHSLQDLYSRMMDQMPERDLNFCRHVLSVATLAYRPLHLAELAVLSGLPPAISIETIVARCGSFLTVRDNYVYLVHQSAKDYLEKNYETRLQPAGHAQGHAGIGRRSIDAMFSILRKNIHSLSFGFKSKEMTPPDPDPLAPIRYSCVYWAKHLCFKSPEYKREWMEDGSVSRFLKEHFLHWLESLSLLGKLSDAVPSIRELLHVAQSQQTDASLLVIRMLEDAKKFVLQNRWVIENAPLQVYASALMFAPTNCVIRKIFEKEAAEWIKVKPIVENTWGVCLQTLEGHRDLVTSVAFSPDSNILASASGDGTIKIWDASTGALQQTLEGHKNWVTSVTFSPDSKVLASASNDKSIKIWDASTGALQQTLEGHKNWVTSVTFSPDSKVLASASRDTTIKIWDAATCALRQTLEGHRDSVTSVAFSPDSRVFASASRDKTIKIWDSDTGALQQTLKVNKDWVNSATFSPDSKLLVSASRGRTIRIWDVTTGVLQQTLKSHTDWVTSVAFSPNSKVLASASRDMTIKIWDAVKGGLQHTLEGHKHWITSVAFSPDSKVLASASRDETIKIWDAVTGPFHQTVEGHTDSVTSVTFSPDSKVLASASSDGTIKLWDAAAGPLQQTLSGHVDFVTSVTFSPDSKVLASGSRDGTIKIWDVVTGFTQQTLESHKHSVMSMVFLADSKFLASGSRDGTIRIWDAVTGALQQTLKGHADSVMSLAFSPVSKALASASRDGTIKIWDAATGALHQTLEGHTGWANSAAFSPDSKVLTSASRDNTIKSWDAAISFDNTGLYLNTNIGHIDLANESKALRIKALSQTSHAGQDQKAEQQRYGLNGDGSWITWNEDNVLWLPPDYRPSVRAISSFMSPSTGPIVTMIALGCSRGKVVVIGLAASGPSPRIVAGPWNEPMSALEECI